MLFAWKLSSDVSMQNRICEFKESSTRLESWYLENYKLIFILN